MSLPAAEEERGGDRNRGRRRRGGRLRRSLEDLHVRLRTEGDTPRRRAGAVALGMFLGALPVWGLHLALCTVLARLLRVSRVLTYMAAHVNNPLTFPFLLWFEWGVGHLLTQGRWPQLAFADVRAQGTLGVTRDVLLGSLVVGLALAVVAGAVTWLVATRRSPTQFAHLREVVAERYLGAGVLHWEFVRGKLRYDPVYRALLTTHLLPRAGHLVDLGCGRGILLALLCAVEDEAEPGEEPPPMELTGFDLKTSYLAAARIGLQTRARIRRADLADPDFTPPDADTAVLLDVLHYLPAAAQERLVAATADALAPGGVLIVREADADAGWRFRATAAAERLAALARGRVRQRFHYRGRAAWAALLAAAGLETEGRDMSQGTPYGNVLLVGRKPAGPGGDGDHRPLDGDG